MLNGIAGQDNIPAKCPVNNLGKSRALRSRCCVSGIVAGLLSVRRDLIGRPEIVKQLLMDTAIDLRRERSYQGHGMAHLLRALQGVTMPAAPSISALPAPQRSVVAAGVMPSAVAAVVPKKITASPLRLMCSYARKDQQLWAELRNHLAPLEMQNIIQIWYDGVIEPGQEWDPQIEHALADAEIILMLISSNFVSSRYITQVELPRAIERHNSGSARVIPVILHDLDWQGMPVQKLNVLPKDARPVTMWSDQHAAWADVARGIRKAATTLREARLPR